MEAPQKIKNRVTMWPSDASSGYVPKKFENIYLQGCMHPYVHCSIIHGGRGMETTEVPFDRGVGKEDVVHMYNGILLSHQRR